MRVKYVGKSMMVMLCLVPLRHGVTNAFRERCRMIFDTQRSDDYFHGFDQIYFSTGSQRRKEKHFLTWVSDDLKR